MRRGWINMLSTIPSVSTEKSRALACTFSCPLLLRNTYSDKNLSILDKKNILQDKFQDFSSSSLTQNNKKNRIESKLSNRIFQIFTSFDDKKLFDE